MTTERIPQAWKNKKCDSQQFDIYIAGDYDQIVRSCRKFCTDRSYCVSVFPCDFPYKFGCESGAKITLINYARFPLSTSQLFNMTCEIASFLAEELSQGSYSIIGNGVSSYYSRRDGE